LLYYQCAPFAILKPKKRKNEKELDHISVAIDQETGPAEMRCQPEGAVEPLGEHAFGFRKLVGKE
jgi:hypothetical protein